MVAIRLNKYSKNMYPVIDPYRKSTLPIKENISACNLFFILNNKEAVHYISNIIKTMQHQFNDQRFINITKYNTAGLDLDIIKHDFSTEIRHHCITNQNDIERNMWLSSNLKMNDFIIIGHIEKLTKFHSVSQFALHAMHRQQQVIILKNSKEEIHSELEQNRDFYSYMNGIKI